MIIAAFGESLGNVLVNIFATIGAGALGYFATIGGLWLLGKFALNKHLPKPAVRVVATVAGVLVAVFVAGLLFDGTGKGSGGGFGLWGKAWAGIFGSEKKDDNPPQVEPNPKPPATETQPPQTRKTDRENNATASPSADALRILMLGSDRVKKIGTETAYYQVQPSGEAHTFEGLKSVIRDRMNGKPPLRGIVIVIEDGSVSRELFVVKRLEEFAKDQRLAVTHELPKIRD